MNRVPVDRMLVRGGEEVLTFRINDDAMVEAGVMNDDYVFVRKQSNADRGDVVVAILGDEHIVRYYYPERDYVRFQPANSVMAPVLVPKPVKLVGVVIGLYRRMT